MEPSETIHRLQHRGACLVGGFLGGYALLEVGGALGNAQTMNLIELVLELIGKNFPDVLLRLLAFGLYLGAAMLFVFVRDKSRLDPRRVSLCITALAAVVLVLLPPTAHSVVRLYPIFFSMSFQWNAFPGAHGYVSSSIFSTNNTRQVGLSLAEYLVGHDKKKLHKMRFFLGSLLCFHVGVALAWASVVHLQRYAPLVVLVLLLFPLAATLAEKQEVTA